MSKLLEVLKNNKERAKQKELEDYLPKLYDSLRNELESVLTSKLLHGDKESVTIEVVDVEPKYFIDILENLDSELYTFEQLSMTTYKFRLKSISLGG